MHPLKWEGTNHGSNFRYRCSFFSPKNMHRLNDNLSVKVSSSRGSDDELQHQRQLLP